MINLTILAKKLHQTIIEYVRNYADIGELSKKLTVGILINTRMPVMIKVIG